MPDAIVGDGKVDSMPSSALKQRLMPGVTRGAEGASRKMPLGRGSALNRTVEASIKPARPLARTAAKKNPVAKALGKPSAAAVGQGTVGPRGNV